jgi:hypothetical protein
MSAFDPKRTLSTLSKTALELYSSSVLAKDHHGYAK